MRKSLAWGALGVSTDPAETLARQACRAEPTDQCRRCSRSTPVYELDRHNGVCDDCYEELCDEYMDDMRDDELEEPLDSDCCQGCGRALERPEEYDNGACRFCVF